MHQIKLLFVLSLLCFKGIAQNNGAAKLTVQPEIMVMPYTKEGEDVRTILDNNPKLRIGISKTNEAFSKRGFKPKNFVAVLKEAREANIFNADNQTDIKSQLALFAAADIYVEVDLIPHSERDETNVTIILKGFEASTGAILSEKTDNSGNWRTKDTGQLASAAVEKIADQFLEMMNSQFATIREDGKTVKVYINFATGSTYSTDSEISGTNKAFSDLMEIWMEDNAYKGYSKLASTMPKSLIFTDVHIPYKDIDRTKRSDTPTKFRTLILDYLKTLKMPATGYAKSGSIYITIK